MSDRCQRGEGGNSYYSYSGVPRSMMLQICQYAGFKCYGNHVLPMNLEIKFVIGILILSGFALNMTMAPNAAFAARVPFAVQNVTQSIPVPGFEESFQIAPILPPREDGKLYTGTLSYTTNVPVEFTTLHPLNQTIQPQGFPVNVPGLNFTVSGPAPQDAKTSDSKSFAASGVVLLLRNPTPFTVSYSLDGELVDPQPPPK